MDRNFGGVSSERKYFILVSILFFNLVLVSTQVVLKGRRTLFQAVVGFIASPFQIAFQETADFISHEFKHYVFLKDSFEKYREIRKKYTRLKYENYLLKRKLAEQRFLQGAKDTFDDFIKADVISIDQNFPLSNLMINKGSRDGIVRDMTVLNQEAELVGRIVEPVSLFSSKVRLVTSSIGGVGAYIEKNQLEGLLTGSNSDICRFKYLVADKPVFKNDRVVTSGTDNLFPPYIPIGRVVAVQKDYLTQKVDVKPFFIEKPIKQLIVINKE
jgi:rod shape-determining protein MreC